VRVDRIQERNLADNPAYAQKVETLKAVLKQWQDETGDTFPENSTPDWYHRDTGKPLPAKDQRGEMPGAAKNADRINKKGPF